MLRHKKPVRKCTSSIRLSPVKELSFDLGLGVCDLKGEERQDNWGPQGLHGTTFAVLAIRASKGEMMGRPAWKGGSADGDQERVRFQVRRGQSDPAIITR